MTDRETIQRLTCTGAFVFIVYSAFWFGIGWVTGVDFRAHRLNWTAETHIGCRVDWVSDLRVCHWEMPDGTTVDTRSM